MIYCICLLIILHHSDAILKRDIPRMEMDDMDDHSSSSGLSSDIHLNDEKRLIKNLLDNYKVIWGRPVHTQRETITVSLTLTLSQILDLDEKNQVLTTNFWVTYKWIDFHLSWAPAEYGNITKIRIPPSHIWTPDIVLYNHADMRIEEKRPCLATIENGGNVMWMPQCVFKSTCNIDIKSFPYDEQVCNMKFGSWTYDGFQLDLQFEPDVAEEINLQTYIPNNEWQIIMAPGFRSVFRYDCCVEPFPDITYYIFLKRQGGFYNYILVLPCVLLSSLTLVLFWLPPESPSKLTLGMNIFVAFFLLLLLLADSTPQASSKIPMLGAYYCANMILIATSTFLCTIVVNIYLRGDKRGRAPIWVRKIFIDLLAQIYCMNWGLAAKNIRKTTNTPAPNNFAPPKLHKSNLRFANETNKYERFALLKENGTTGTTTYGGEEKNHFETPYNSGTVANNSQMYRLEDNSPYVVPGYGMACRSCHPNENEYGAHSIDRRKTTSMKRSQTPGGVGIVEETNIHSQGSTLQRKSHSSKKPEHIKMNIKSKPVNEQTFEIEHHRTPTIKTDLPESCEMFHMQHGCCEPHNISQYHPMYHQNSLMYRDQFTTFPPPPPPSHSMMMGAPCPHCDTNNPSKLWQQNERIYNVYDMNRMMLNNFSANHQLNNNNNNNGNLNNTSLPHNTNINTNNPIDSNNVSNLNSPNNNNNNNVTNNNTNNLLMNKKTPGDLMKGVDPSSGCTCMKSQILPSLPSNVMPNAYRQHQQQYYCGTEGGVNMSGGGNIPSLPPNAPPPPIPPILPPPPPPPPLSTTMLPHPSICSCSLFHMENDLREVRDYLRRTRKRLEDQEVKNRISSEWKVVAMTLDRTFFLCYVFTIMISLIVMFPRATKIPLYQRCIRNNTYICKDYQDNTDGLVDYKTFMKEQQEQNSANILSTFPSIQLMLLLLLQHFIQELFFFSF
ncbi:hypothetical protein SNEBB_006325 [Seison nebaliae]|nr:hypothetical protein SNEBB_006325 [Seison nebaliae]